MSLSKLYYHNIVGTYWTSWTTATQPQRGVLEDGRLGAHGELSVGGWVKLLKRFSETNPLRMVRSK